MNSQLIVIERDELTELAAQIDEEHESCRESMTDGLQHAINAGNLLIQAKALCKHGEWLDWVKANCTFSERTARAYMRLAHGLSELDSNRQRVADLSFREALALLAEPDEEPESTRPENLHISDDSYEWFTPADYIESARTVMGSIDTDDHFIGVTSVLDYTKIRCYTYYIYEQRYDHLNSVLIRLRSTGRRHAHICSDTYRRNKKSHAPERTGHH